MTEREALKLALEALDYAGYLTEPEGDLDCNCLICQATVAVKEALAQQDQEKERCVGCEACIDTACGRDECPKGWPKAAQPEQEPTRSKKMRDAGITRRPKGWDKDGDEPEQPFGWLYSLIVEGQVVNEKFTGVNWDTKYEPFGRYGVDHGGEVTKTPLYTTPPQRTWVGLTADEIDLLEELYAPPVHPDFVNDADHCLELIRHVEAKLKQKNGYDS